MSSFLLEKTELASLISTDMQPVSSGSSARLSGWWCGVSSRAWGQWGSWGSWGQWGSWGSWGSQDTQLDHLDQSLFSQTSSDGSGFVWRLTKAIWENKQEVLKVVCRSWSGRLPFFKDLTSYSSWLFFDFFLSFFTFMTKLLQTEAHIVFYSIS